MKKILRLAIVFIIAGECTSCVAPHSSPVVRGRRQGGVAGAAIGGAVGGWEGAAAGALIGGAAGNLIARSVSISGNASTGNTIRGNKIGTNADGTASLATTGEGVLIENCANTTIGPDNLIAANTLGGVRITRGDNQLNDAFRRFKDLADKKKVVWDEDIVALVDDEVMRGHDRIRFVGLEVWAGSRGPQRALLELEIDGRTAATSATGDGPVDATFKAIRNLFPHDAELKLFSVGAVTEGTDAQAKVTVRLEEHGKMVDGQAADTDTLVASARAYIHALNKLLVKRVRTEPAALIA